MENLEFMLGVLSTVGIFLVGYASIGVFKVKTKVEDVKDSIDKAYLAMDEIGKDFYSNINNSRQDYQNQIDEIYRQMDSRFDKLENKLSK
jgi:hypothetical protein